MTEGANERVAPVVKKPPEIGKIHCCKMGYPRFGLMMLFYLIYFAFCLCIGFSFLPTYCKLHTFNYQLKSYYYYGQMDILYLSLLYNLTVLIYLYFFEFASYFNLLLYPI